MFHDLLNFTSQGRQRLHRAKSMSSKQLMIRGNLLYIPLKKTLKIYFKQYGTMFQKQRGKKNNTSINKIGKYLEKNLLVTETPFAITTMN